MSNQPSSTLREHPKANDWVSTDDRAAWARRLRAEREARDWTVPDAVRAMIAHADKPLVSEDSLIRYWRRWEAAAYMPDVFHRSIIAAAFGMEPQQLFPVRSLSQCVESIDELRGDLEQRRALIVGSMRDLRASLDNLQVKLDYIDALLTIPQPHLAIVA